MQAIEGNNFFVSIPCLRAYPDGSEGIALEVCVGLGIAFWCRDSEMFPLLVPAAKIHGIW